MKPSIPGIVREKSVILERRQPTHRRRRLGAGGPAEAVVGRNGHLERRQHNDHDSRPASPDRRVVDTGRERARRQADDAREEAEARGEEPG